MVQKVINISFLHILGLIISNIILCTVTQQNKYLQLHNKIFTSYTQVIYNFHFLFEHFYKISYKLHRW